MSSACVLGTGVDIVENGRMHEVLERWGRRFKDRVFLSGEQSYCETKAAPHCHYAGRFAVKEAVAKAFGTGVCPQLGWLDIEVVTDRVSGAPRVCLSRRGQDLACSRNAGGILVSLAHTRNYAVAHALVLARHGV